MSAFFRGIRVSAFGAPSVLKLESNIPALKPAPSQVLVKMATAGVNPVDTYMRNGKYGILPSLPYTPGRDGAGIVEEVGSAVTRVKRGDRVYITSTVSGTYADYSLNEIDYVFRLPDGASFETGACLGVPYFTAYRALFHKGKITPTSTILVHGASGGVGIACIQLAKAHGAKVIGTAGTPEGLKVISEQGVDHALDHNNPAHFDQVVQLTGGKGVDLIVEMLANVNLGKDLPLLAKYGRVALVGSRGTVEINPRDLMGKEAEVFGVTLFNASPQDLAEAASAVEQGISSGHIKGVVGKVFQLEEAIQAHEFVVPDDKPSSGATGRVILKIAAL